MSSAAATPAGPRRRRWGPPAAARRWAAARSARSGAPEAGTSLVELLVAMLVLGIALGITAVIVVMVSAQSGTQVNQGRAVETAEVSMSGLTQYLQGAVSPEVAYRAQGNAGVPTSAADLCWDDTFDGPPAPSLPQSPLVQTDPTGGASIPPGYSSQATTPVDASTLSVIYAHDYDVELCAYPVDVTSPVVYEIYLNHQTCAAGNADGYCTVDVVRYRTTGTVGTTNCAVMANWYHDPSSPCARIVDEVRNVWCDAQCRAATAEPTGQTVHDSCWSYLPAAEASGSSAGLPADCTSATGSVVTDKAAYTPPLFSYYGTSGATGAALNNPAAPMDLFCGSPGGSCTASVDHTQNLLGAGIAAVSIDMTVLSGSGSGATPRTRSPGAPVTAYLRLENVHG